MSQQLQHHHPQYVHYNPNPHLQQQPPQPAAQQQSLPVLPHTLTHVAPKDTQHHQTQQHHQPAPAPLTSTLSDQQQQQTQQQPQAGGSGTTPSAPLVARGDWTKDLVQLAKTAELKKHALTLQLHTAHILSAHASIEQKGKAIQDLREQKNKLESERSRLLASLAEVNADRDKVDMTLASLEKECQDTRLKITHLTDTDYAVAKADVDRLRKDLGQPPLPSLQSTLDEKTSQYLTERRISGNDAQQQIASTSASAPARSSAIASQSSASQSTSTAPGSTNANNKRSASTSISHQDGQSSSKRPRGRPKGSKNKKAGANEGGD